MSFHCPNPRCIAFGYRLSRKDMREDGDRCTLPLCGSLYRKVEVASTPVAPPAAPAVASFQTQKSGEVRTVAHKQPQPPVLRQCSAVVVQVHSNPALELVYPPLVDRTSAPCEREEPSNEEVTVLVPIRLAPCWMRPQSRPQKKRVLKHPANATLKAFGKLKPAVKLALLQRHGFEAIVSALRANERRVKAEAARAAALKVRAKIRAKKALRWLKRSAAGRKARLQRQWELATDGKQLVEVKDGFQIVLAEPKMVPAVVPAVKVDRVLLRSSKKKASSPLVRKEQDFSCLADFPPLRESVSVEHSFAPMEGWMRKASTGARMLGQPVRVTAETLVSARLTLRGEKCSEQLLKVADEVYATPSMPCHGKLVCLLDDIAVLIGDSAYWDSLPNEWHSYSVEGLVAYCESLEQQMRVYRDTGMDTQGLFSSCRLGFECIAKYVGDGIKKWTGDVTEHIFSVVKREFYKIFEKFLDKIAPVRNFIEMLWGKVKEWIHSLSTAADMFVDVMAQELRWVVALFLVCGMCLVVERALVSVGILTSVGSLTNLLLVTLIGGSMLCATTMVDEELAHMAKVFKETVYSVLCPGANFAANASHVPSPREVAQSILDTHSFNIFYPIELLSTLGEGLCKFNVDTVKYFGSLGNAIDGCRKGIVCLRDLMAKVIECAGQIWDKITGQKATFFNEVSNLLRVDIGKWIERSQRLLQEAVLLPTTDCVLKDVCEALVDQGIQLKVGLAGMPRKTSMDYGTVVSGILDKLNVLLVQCQKNAAFVGRRKEPFWVYIWGPSHCGKSNYMDTITRELLDDIGRPRSSIYPKTAGDSYWSGYLQQAAIQIDDLHSVQILENSIESQLLQIVSTKEAYLNMADLPSKGTTLYNTPLIITSSNVREPPTNCNLLDETAFNNRKAIVLRMDFVDPLAIFDPERPYANSKFIFEDRLAGVPCTGWMDVEAATDYILTARLAHSESQEKQMACYLRQNAQDHPVQHRAKEIIQECIRDMPRMLRLDIPLPEETRFGEYAFVTCDGESYAFHLDGTCRKLNEYVAGIEELEINRVFNHIDSEWRKLGVYESGDDLVVDFTQTLLSGPCRVSSVGSLNEDASVSQRRFFDGLSLGERIYLRLLQKRLDNTLEHFKMSDGTSYYDAIKNSLIEGYQFLKTHKSTIARYMLYVVALVLLIGSCYTFFQLLAGLFGGGGTCLATTLVNLDTHSRGEVRTQGRSNRPVVERYMNTHSGGTPPSREDQLRKLSVIISFIAGGQEYHFMGARFFGGSIVLTGHQAYYIPDGTRVSINYIDNAGQECTMSHVWRHANIVRQHGNELIVYKSPQFSHLPDAMKSLICSDPDTQLSTHFEITVLASQISKATRTPTYRHWRTTAVAKEEDLPISDAYSSGTYKYIVKRYIHSMGAGKPDDCGALVCTNVGGVLKVVGMHVAGRDGRNGACFLPIHSDMDAHFNLAYIPKPGRVTEGYSEIGYLEPQESIRPPKNTKLVEVPRDIRFPVPTAKVPAIIHKDDSRADGFNPYEAGMTKFAQPMADLDEEVLAFVANEIVEEWQDALDEALDDAELHEAINGVMDDEGVTQEEGMVLSTSPGYPYTLEPHVLKGKADYFEEADIPGELKLKVGSSAETMFKKLRKQSLGDVPQLVCTACAKDERVDVKKVTTNKKTRLFEILPLHYNLLLRMKFMKFNSFMQRNRFRLSCQVGTNPYSRDWQDIYRRLREKNDVALNCDYARFDGILSYQVLNCIGNMINECFVDDKVSRRQRKNLLMGISNRLVICCGDVLEVRCGMPSGFALTVVVNSILNEILIRYVFRNTVARVRPSLRFRDNVELVVYGDDNLIAIRNELLPIFNGRVIKSELAKVHITITDGSDKMALDLREKPLSELDFLKRKFVLLDNDRVLAPLDLNSILSSLVWVHAKFRDVHSALFDNVQNALLELSLHPKEVFNEVRSFYVERLPLWAPKLRTYSQCQAMMEEFFYSTRPWCPIEVLDQLVVPEFKRAMFNVGAPDIILPVHRGFYIAGPRWVSPSAQDYLVVDLGHERPHRPLDLGDIHYGLELAPGVGKIPTKRWAQSFKSGKNPVIVRVREALDLDQKIVFRGAHPYIDAWCALTGVLLQLQLCDLSQLEHKYTNLMPGSRPVLSEFFPCGVHTAGHHYTHCGGAFSSVTGFQLHEGPTFTNEKEFKVWAGEKCSSFPVFFSSCNKKDGAERIMFKCCKECPTHIATDKLGPIPMRHMRLLVQMRKQLCVPIVFNNN
ncbi:polyprotein 1 [Grapevine nepovirus A]|uniref:RNA1 polyprotein n=1 Tax=Grapevine nepovirus A TaxID=2789373 RepID=A0A7S8FAE1_9SECO|nr:polyprotein 1 [Grapevine nepovirus A]QPD02150.1 polyprotein 1 [Grapevine nepovirus A]